MKKIIIGLIIIVFYCFPFVYFSMQQDFVNRSMLGYLIMIVATSLFAFLVKVFSNSLLLIIGNVISALISFYFINGMAGNEQWDGYFKPLTPFQLLILVSVLNLIPQFLAIRVTNKYIRKNKP
ncbi:hypothetical protein AAGG74_16050 [Bacillus mexicanus]|uniref:hypothetical protein n=1 Tax=Bacillus mexicanus TaxID=2834415 RepID=UPI003D221E25